MKFHPDKCSVLRVTRSRTPKIHDYKLHQHTLKAEDKTKDLGVTIDSKLCWNSHIDNVTKKANSSLAFLRRNLQISQKHIKANAYTTLVRPQLEYAASVWDPYTKEKQKQLEMVQRRAARYVFNNYSYESSVTPMLNQLGWRSLLQRRADIRLAFLYKSINGLVAVDLSNQLVPHTRFSRHHHSLSFFIPSETTLYLQQSFVPRTIVQWNALPASLVITPSADTFREGVCTVTHH